jgi:hypothetical protein
MNQNNINIKLINIKKAVFFPQNFCFPLLSKLNRFHSLEKVVISQHVFSVPQTSSDEIGLPSDPRVFQHTKHNFMPLFEPCFAAAVLGTSSL